MKTKAVSWHNAKVNIPGVAWRNYDSENAFHIYCADWLRKRYEVTGDDCFTWWHHSANERSNAREGFLAKMMGQSRGFPDMVHLGMRLAIELKVPGGVVSDKQSEWLRYLTGVGWVAKVVWSFEEFVGVVEERGPCKG